MKASITSLLFFCCVSVNAQTHVKQKLYTAKIITNKATVSGALLNCRDSTIAIVDLRLAKSSVNPSDNEIQVIPVSDVIRIKIRRTGAIRRGFLTFGIIGGLTGAIMGLADRPDEDLNAAIEPLSAANYALSGAFVGFTIGGAIGLAAGSPSKNFQINQQYDAYHKHKETLTKYVYKPNY